MSCKKPNCDCLEQQANKDGVDIYSVKGGYECLYGDNRADEVEKHNLDRESPPVTAGKKSVFCTLSDKELITKANQWIQRLIKSDGKDWMFSVQGDANSDVDLILSEVVERFESIITSPVTADIEEAAKAEVGLEDIEHASQTDYSFIEGAKFGVEWQKQQMAVTGTAEEISTSDKIKLANNILIENTTHAHVCTIEGERVPYYNHGEVIKSMLAYNTSTQSATIERLEQEIEKLTSENTDLYHNGEQLELQRTENLQAIERLTKAMEEINEFADSSIVVKRIAREALASIKK